MALVPHSRSPVLKACIFREAATCERPAAPGGCSEPDVKGQETTYARKDKQLGIFSREKRRPGQCDPFLGTSKGQGCEERVR